MLHECTVLDCQELCIREAADEEGVEAGSLASPVSVVAVAEIS